MKPGDSGSSAARVAGILRRSGMDWMFSVLLLAPVALQLGSVTGTDLSVLYLGIAGAWVATRVMERGGLPGNLREWAVRLAAVVVFTVGNTGLFVVLAEASGMESTIPLGAVGILSMLPVIGVVPWMMMRVREGTGAIVLSAAVVLGCKLAACIVARTVYGPRYIELGYASSDWHTAKLMIGLFWALCTAVSLICLVQGARLFSKAVPEQGSDARTGGTGLVGL